MNDPSDQSDVPDEALTTRRERMSAVRVAVFLGRLLMLVVAIYPIVLHIGLRSITDAWIRESYDDLAPMMDELLVGYQALIGFSFFACLASCIVEARWGDSGFAMLMGMAILLNLVVMCG